MKINNKENKKTKRSISDLKVFIFSSLTLLLLLIIQPDTLKRFSEAKTLSLFTIFIVDLIKIFMLTWLMPFATLVVAVLAYRNIILTKESMSIAKNTLRQMQFSDRKNTSPMLWFNLSIKGTEALEPYYKDDKRPREIILWDAKAIPTEKASPHFLNLSLKNMQEHPQGVATNIKIKISLSFPMCEGTEQFDTENLEVPFSFMDPKEEYSQNIIKVSGLPILSAKIESISYKDMFGQQSVIGYGHGMLEMKGNYLYSSHFVTLSGQTPDEPTAIE